MADWSKIFGSPSPIPLDQLFAGTTPAPLNTFNFGDPGSGGPGNGNDQALASIQSDALLNHILARQAAGFRPLPDYSSAAALDTARASNEALASIQSDALLNHILARQAAGLRPLPDYSSAAQTPSSEQSWAGVQPAPLRPVNIIPEDPLLRSWERLGPSIPRLQPIAAAGPAQNTNGGSAASSPPLKFWPVPDYGTLNPGNHATDEGIGTFGAPRDGGRKHEGIDIQAPVGTPVVAAADGRVVDVYASPTSYFGNQVVIDHGNGLFTQSAHLDMLGVKPGDAVSAGQIIGLSGRSGGVPSGARSHVHYEVRLGSKSPVAAGGKVDDPLRYLPPPP